LAQLRRAWDRVGVRRVDGDQAVAQIGERRDVRVLVELGELSPRDVSVELLHGAVAADGALRHPLVQPLAAAGEVGGDRYEYRGSFTCGAAGEYGLTVRVVPDHDDLQSWADTGCVAWTDDDEPAGP
ncbi:MAG: hypothetical protein M3276_00955, partial [Actinomycetota bacterium]|nr:hypothetical protein [Actinomycetota bacterium]